MSPLPKSIRINGAVLSCSKLLLECPNDWHLPYCLLHAFGCWQALPSHGLNRPSVFCCVDLHKFASFRGAALYRTSPGAPSLHAGSRLAQGEWSHFTHRGRRRHLQFVIRALWCNKQQSSSLSAELCC